VTASVPPPPSTTASTTQASTAKTYGRPGQQPTTGPIGGPAPKIYTPENANTKVLTIDPAAPREVDGHNLIIWDWFLAVVVKVGGTRAEADEVWSGSKVLFQPLDEIQASAAKAKGWTPTEQKVWLEVMRVRANHGHLDDRTEKDGTLIPTGEKSSSEKAAADKAIADKVAADAVKPLTPLPPIRPAASTMNTTILLVGAGLGIYLLTQ
jgi:hypothetical protein